MTNDFYEKFKNVINTLIELNIESRNEHSRVKDLISTRVWAEHYCTVRADIGRATGKTRYISEAATPDDLCIIGGLKKDGTHKSMLCDVVCISEINYWRTDKKYKKIYIENQSFDLGRICEYFADGDNTFIVLGS